MTIAEKYRDLPGDREAPESRIEEHAGLLSTIPPLVPGDWLALEPDTASRIMRSLPERLGYSKRAALRARELPFFPGWILLESVEPVGAKRRVRSAIFSEDEMVLLDGDMAKVHAVREKVFVPGGEDHTLDYLRFFTTACRGEKGRFHIVMDPSDLSPGEAVSLAARDIVRIALLDPILATETPEGWVFRIRLFYGADLFDTKFIVPRDGVCEMREDILLTAGALSRTEDWENGALTIPANREAGHGL